MFDFKQPFLYLKPPYTDGAGMGNILFDGMYFVFGGEP